MSSPASRVKPPPTSTATHSNLFHRLSALVERFGGSLIGDPEIQVIGFAPLDSAGPQHLSFISQTKYRKQLGNTQAAAVLMRAADHEWLNQQNSQQARRPGYACWICDNPYAQFAQVAQFFDALSRPATTPGIAPGALVDPRAELGDQASISAQSVIAAGAKIGARVQIGAGCIIGRGVEIGDDSILHARVVIQDQCILGQRCIVHPGAVIGADGFGFAKQGDAWIKIPQSGRVIIGNDVEIGANTTIDRGALADTVIGNGVKLDNQIQIGHNVRIGDHTAMAGCVGIAGSAVIGERCTVGGGAIILGHLVVADDVHISTASVVTHSLHQAGHYSGFYPIDDHAAWEKSAASVRGLAKLRERLRILERNQPKATES